MSVFLEPGRKSYRYDFWYKGKRHRGSTEQTDLEAARRVEYNLKEKLRKQRGGIAELADSIPITDWAGTYYAHQVRLKRLTGYPKDLDRYDVNLRVVLRFFGARPTDPTSKVLPAEGEEAPFHNLTLHNILEEPSWLTEFDEWVLRRGVSKQTRSQYLSAMSGLYTVAALPEYSKTTGISPEQNPFKYRPRAGKKKGRKATLTPEELQRWISKMAYHARLAVAIGTLAPKLRLESILHLERGVHINADVTTITIDDHKTDQSGEPQVVTVDPQLRTIILDAYTRMKKGTTHVVQYQGKPVEHIDGALRSAAERAGLVYGRMVGITFHSLRHTASSFFAATGVNPFVQKDTMGHATLDMEAWYTHIRQQKEREVLAGYSEQNPIAAIVMDPARRAPRLVKSAGGLSGGPPSRDVQKPEEKRTTGGQGAWAVGRRFARKAQ